MATSNSIIFKSMGIKTLLLRSSNAMALSDRRQWEPDNGGPYLKALTKEGFLGEHYEGLHAKQSPHKPFTASLARKINIPTSEELNVASCHLCLLQISLVNESFDCVRAFNFIKHIQSIAIVDGGPMPSWAFWAERTICPPISPSTTSIAPSAWPSLLAKKPSRPP